MYRYPLLLLGHLAFALGLAGVFVPGLPTVVFWLIAAWAYGKSCPHLREKVLSNPRYGVILRAWVNHGVVPQKAKLFAGLSMLLSLVVLALTTKTWFWPVIVAACMVPVYWYIVSRPSAVPSVSSAILSDAGCPRGKA